MTYPHTILIAFLHLLFLSGHAQTGSGPHRFDSTRNAAFHFADSVFARPTFLYENLQPEISAEMEPILIRMNNAIVANQDWFMDYRNKYAASGEPLPYNERFGITRDEYYKVQHLESQPPQLVVVDSQTVAVVADHGLIQFKSEGSTHLPEIMGIQEMGLFLFDLLLVVFKRGTNAFCRLDYREHSLAISRKEIWIS